jgi:hypothetical protein
MNRTYRTCRTYKDKTGIVFFKAMPVSSFGGIAAIHIASEYSPNTRRMASATSPRVA